MGKSQKQVQTQIYDLSICTLEIHYGKADLTFLIVGMVLMFQTRVEQLHSNLTYFGSFPHFAQTGARALVLFKVPVVIK